MNEEIFSANTNFLNSPPRKISYPILHENLEDHIYARRKSYIKI